MRLIGATAVVCEIRSRQLISMTHSRLDHLIRNVIGVHLGVFALDDHVLEVGEHRAALVVVEAAADPRQHLERAVVPHDGVAASRAACPSRSPVDSVKPMTATSSVWRGLILNRPALSLRATSPSAPSWHDPLLEDVVRSRRRSRGLLRLHRMMRSPLPNRRLMVSRSRRRGRRARRRPASGRRPRSAAASRSASLFGWRATVATS